MNSKIKIYEDVDSCRYDSCKTHLEIQHSHHSGPCEEKKSKLHYFLLDCPGEDAEKSGPIQENPSQKNASWYCFMGIQSQQCPFMAFVPTDSI